MIVPLFAALLLGGAPSYPMGLPPFSPALGRPLAWDPYGAYALDAEGTLPKADDAILAQVRAGELGRAEVLCRNRLKAEGDDVLAANSSSSVPGFTATDKHVGIPAYRARAGQKADNNWVAHDLNVSYDASAGPGAYGVRYAMSWQTHYGTVDAFNVLGRSEKQGFSYKLDTESNYIPLEIKGGSTL